MAYEEKPWYDPWVPPWWRGDDTLSDQEWYQKKQKAFVEENGYFITLPEFEDIIHIRKPPEISKAEYKEWSWAQKKGTIPNIHPAKKDYLDLKRRRFESIMATPQPGWMQKVASVLTWLDDTEDAVSTAVMIARFALKLTPRIGARFVPYLGWALLAGDILTLGQMTWSMVSIGGGTPTGKKRRLYEKASMNPFSKSGKLRRATKLAKKLPTAGELIEGLQTLDNLAGVGVSFGPIMGCLNDFAAGAVRKFTGEKVSIRLAGQSGAPTHQRIMRGLTTAPDIWNGSPDWDDELYEMSLLAYGVGISQLEAEGVDISTEYNEIEDWTDYEVEGRRPWKDDTIWMLEENGINIEESIGWPTNGKRWISYGERAEGTITNFQDKFKKWAERNTHSQQAYMTSQYMVQATEYFLEHGEDPDNVKYQFNDEMALVLNTYHNNFFPEPGTSDEKIRGWIARCKAYKAESGVLPPTRYQKWMGEQEGIIWTDHPPEKNIGLAAEIWPEFA